jgi:hypothetical protein
MSSFTKPPKELSSSVAVPLHSCFFFAPMPRCSSSLWTSPANGSLLRSTPFASSWLPV